MDFIKWANTARTALYIQAPPTISDKDRKEILREIHIMLVLVDHPVDLIVDRRNAIGVPRKMLISMQRVVSNQNFHRIVFIGFSMLPKMLVETLTRLPGVFSSDPIFVDTLTEACEKLGITDPILNDTHQA